MAQRVLFIIIAFILNACNQEQPQEDPAQSQIEEYTKELKDFAMYLKHAGICIKDIGISYCDDNFINLFIQTLDNDEKNIFYTVTKKYYEEHVFYYYELFL